MPSIPQVQRSNLGFLDSVAGDGWEKFETFEARGVFEQYGKKFMDVLRKQAAEKNVVASGAMLRNSSFKVSEDGKILQIWVPDYFDYPNEGVKGVRSSKNAPNSPYQFKHYGMSAEGRASIKRYIESGHAKIKTVLKNQDKALGIGREGKHLSLIDIKTNQLIYNIKKYGIKATGYFNDTITETFVDFEQVMSEAIGKDIVFTLQKFDRHGNNN